MHYAPTEFLEELPLNQGPAGEFFQFGGDLWRR